MHRSGCTVTKRENTPQTSANTKVRSGHQNHSRRHAAVADTMKMGLAGAAGPQIHAFRSSRVSTAAPSIHGFGVVDDTTDALWSHVATCLAKLWGPCSTPVWVADTQGRIVYTNLAAEVSRNGAGRRHASASVAAVAGHAAVPPPSQYPPLEIAPLTDATGRRLGWLAIATATA